MTIDPSDQAHQERGASRCWPLPSASAEAVLCRPAVDAAAEVPVVAPPAPVGAGHGMRRPADRLTRRVGSPPGPEPAGPEPMPPEPVGDAAGVPMPAFDERRAAALACQESAAHRNAYECLAAAGGAHTDDRGAALELVAAG